MIPDPRAVGLQVPFIRSGQNHLARHSERGKKTRRTEEEVGRQYQGMNRSNSPSPRGQWIIEKMEETGCKIICGAPTTLAVKGQMMMMMMLMMKMMMYCLPMLDSTAVTYNLCLLSYLFSFSLGKTVVMSRLTRTTPKGKKASSVCYFEGAY